MIPWSKKERTVTLTNGELAVIKSALFVCRTNTVEAMMQGFKPAPVTDFFLIELEEKIERFLNE